MEAIVSAERQKLLEQLLDAVKQVRDLFVILTLFWLKMGIKPYFVGSSSVQFDRYEHMNIWLFSSIWFNFILLASLYMFGSLMH